MSRSKVTMNDIAKAAGVSQSTVSMILSKGDTASFATDTVIRVRKMASKMGYTIGDGSKKDMASRNIMVISISSNNPYYNIMLNCIEHQAYTNNFNIISCNTHRSPKIEEACLDIAVKSNVAGIIMLSYPHNSKKLQEVSKILPVVCVCDCEVGLPLDTVAMNHVSSASLLVDHLVSLGHKNITFITTDTDANEGRAARCDGLRLQMEKHGLGDGFDVRMSGDSNWLTEMQDFSIYYNMGYQLMQDDSIYQAGTSAFVGINDLVAFGIMDALIDRGYEIPRDFSVCGFDNSFYASLRGTSLTTIDQRMEDKGKNAFQLLLRKIDIASADANSETLSDIFKMECQPRLIVRDSTGPARGHKI